MARRPKPPFGFAKMKKVRDVFRAVTRSNAIRKKFGSAVRSAYAETERTGSYGKGLKHFYKKMEAAAIKVGTANPQHDFTTKYHMYLEKAINKGVDREMAEKWKHVQGIKSSHAKRYTGPKLSKEETDKVINEVGDRLKTPKQWAAEKDPWVDYKGPEPLFDRHGNVFERKFAARMLHRIRTRGPWVAASGAAILGYASDKGSVDVGFQDKQGRGLRIQQENMTVHNKEGFGTRFHGRVAGSLGRDKSLEIRGGGGLGYAPAHGSWANQFDIGARAATPIGKANLDWATQHSFGMKKRSRRVAALKRAIFGNELYLSGRKPTKQSRKADSLSL